MSREFGFLEQISRARCTVVLSFSSLPALLPPSVGWEEGRVWAPADPGFTLFCEIFSSTLCVGSMFDSLQVIFRFSCICCIFVFYVIWEGGFHLAFLYHHFFRRIPVCIPYFIHPFISWLSAGLLLMCGHSE